MRKKHILQENAELKEFLDKARSDYRELESKYNLLLAENSKMKQTLNGIKDLVYPVVTKTITVSSGQLAFSNAHPSDAKE